MGLNLYQAFDELAKRNLHKSPYGYTPTPWICVLYLSLFTITTVVHIVQAFRIKPRSYWVLPTLVTCGFCEILGWGARLWSSRDPHILNPFLIQTIFTILAPTFLTAGYYTILGKIITILGYQYSRLKPRTYLFTFLFADTIALVVQSFGGAKASFAFLKGNNPEPGAHIMLVGIFFQMAGVTLYVLLATEFLLRYHFNRPLRLPSIERVSPYFPDDASGKHLSEGQQVSSRRVVVMVIGLTLATLLVLIRTIYRSAELIGGWTGPIITTEKYFNWFDGAPIFLAMFTLNLLHPRILLRRKYLSPVIALRMGQGIGSNSQGHLDGTWTPHTNPRPRNSRSHERPVKTRVPDTNPGLRNLLKSGSTIELWMPEEK